MERNHTVTSYNILHCVTYKYPSTVHSNATIYHIYILSQKNTQHHTASQSII